MDKVPVIVSAPASMSNVLLAISQQYEKLHPQVDIKLNFGSSGALKRQIEKGAAVDVFISAGKLEMDALSKQGRIDSDTIHNFAENELVLIRPAQTANPVRSLQDLNKNEVKRISIGEPNSVPAGRYAFQSLKHLRLWNDLQPKLVFAKDVRQVLTYVETKNVDAGIVYRTDALSSRKVAIVEQLDSASHEKILYCTGIVKNAAHHPEALQFQQYLLSKEAGYILVKNGFLPLRHQRW
ncbi:molybdate ABC transporter substrate-binding protein [Lihuaxuella thermophila]|nr:molybdate ABC transporter substrate-binding protein [Lihuaxuella thermophila]